MDALVSPLIIKGHLDRFGAYAKKQAGYSALYAHYGFDAVFCNPSEGHEKGLVEGLVGWISYRFPVI